MTTLVEKVLKTDFTADETDIFYRGTITHFYGEGGSRGGSSGCGGSIFDTFKLDIDRNKGSSAGGKITGQISRLPSSPINPVVIPYGDQTQLGGDVHDTFKIDRYENPYWGHTSIKITGHKPKVVIWEDE